MAKNNNKYRNYHTAYEEKRKVEGENEITAAGKGTFTEYK